MPLSLAQNAMAALRGELPDRIPWLIYVGTFGGGRSLDECRKDPLWLELREKGGLAFSGGALVYRVENPNVNVEKERDGDILTTTYETPVGSVSSRQRVGFIFDKAYEKADRPTNTTTWTMEHLLRDLSDYDVVKYMVENAVYTPNYEPYYATKRRMGEDGIVTTGVGASPLQSMLKDFMGYKRWAIDQYSHPGEFEDLLKTIHDKKKELLRIVADSPVEVVRLMDNLNGPVTGPRQFEKYCLPCYREYAEILHRKGKLLLVHMDGLLGCLEDLIAKSDVDIVEGFTPPPMGDLSLARARASWGNKIIWTNFPGSLWHLGPEAVRTKSVQMLREAAPGDCFIMGHTEWIPRSVRNISLRTIGEVLSKYGNCPISIDR